MPNVEWEIQHDLVTQYDTLIMNVVDLDTRRLYLIRPEGYKIVPQLRVTDDNLSQADGSFLHPRFKTGLLATMTVSFLISTDGASAIGALAACGQDLREMHERFMGCIESIKKNGPASGQRLIWYPEPVETLSPRLIDDILITAWADPTFEEPETHVTFSVESPFPYAIDLNQVDTPIDHTSATITNPGTSEMWPVIIVWGPVTSFVIQNDTIIDDDGNPLQIDYDGSRPGAEGIADGHYAEIDTFRGTIFLDGDSTDLTPGLVPGDTDFFPLITGDNTIISNDALIDVLWNPAWA